MYLTNELRYLTGSAEAEGDEEDYGYYGGYVDYEGSSETEIDFMLGLYQVTHS